MTKPIDEDYRDAAGTIAMCMYCRRTRRDSPQGTQWLLVEEYVSQPPKGVSHGLCPECLEKYYPAE